MMPEGYPIVLLENGTVVKTLVSPQEFEDIENTEMLMSILKTALTDQDCH